MGFLALTMMVIPHWKEEYHLSELAGLGKKQPLIAGGMTIFLLSMAGIPMTAGFIGKYLIFSDAVATHQVLPVVLAVLASVVAAFYYLKVIVLMFMKENQKPIVIHYWKGCWITAIVCLIFTLQFGIIPKNFIQLIQNLQF